MMNFPAWMLAHGDNLQFVLFFSLLLVFAVGERLAPRRPGTLDRAIRWPANFFLTAVNVVAMGALPVSFVGAALWAGAHGLGLLNQIRLPLAALVAVTLVVRGFISFST